MDSKEDQEIQVYQVHLERLVPWAHLVLGVQTGLQDRLDFLDHVEMMGLQESVEQLEQWVLLDCLEGVELLVQ